MSGVHEQAHEIGMALMRWAELVDDDDRALTGDTVREMFADALQSTSVPDACVTIMQGLAPYVSPIERAVAVTERTTEQLPPAQVFALARFVMRGLGSERRGDRWFRCSLGGAGLPDDYLHVVMGDGFECGIDPDGRVST
jgi:hypothetical protein